MVKNTPANAGNTWNTGSTPGSRRCLWSTKRQPTPVFLPGKSHGQRSLVCSPWDHKELALTERLSHVCVTRDNLQTVAHLTCVPCNGFSLVYKWNWRWKACQYILKKFSQVYQTSSEEVYLEKDYFEWGSQSVQWLSDVWLFATPWTTAHQASLSITNSRMLRKLMSIESVMPSRHLILCRPLLLPPSIFPSIRVFSNKLVLRIRWQKYWSFRFSLSPSNEYSGLIAFRID